ncbi:MAG TPA: isoprenylcysteine carboxylmethyltransferase family protein [Candidatus Nitrosopolaris sp.]|nr:isoprenylcysteine carboxylmethyltransferase family protein [Candidatus Nitrosopolaris sp.]
MDLPRWVLSLILLAVTLGYLGLGALGWGSWKGYLAHPARAVAIGLVLVLTLVVTVLTDFNISGGKREDIRNRWILLPLILVSLPIAWLPPYLDRRELWVIDGDPIRYVGLALLVGGGVLRVWPMFVLGRRFSGLVAIQEHHELVTNGIYRHLRHPSYLGAVFGFIGWMLVFRCGIGLLLALPLLRPMAARMDAEETLLTSEFGPAYVEYREHTWRLVPWVY